MVRTKSVRPAHQITVERVIDPNSGDLHEALDLYSLRIPEHEQFEPPDIVRWIREDLENMERGIYRPRDFFLIAKIKKRVCGFVLLHYYPKVQLAFIAYLVAARDLGIPNYSFDGVSKSLLAEVRRLLNKRGSLEDCRGLLLEVDRPSNETTGQEWIERLARIRLFCMLAEAQGFSLRAFDMEYLQPPLSLAEPDLVVPMLLMYVNPKATKAAGSMNRARVRKILKFIYADLYPEGYSDDERENRAYKARLRSFCAARSEMLPEKIRMLDFKQLKASIKKPVKPASEPNQVARQGYAYDVFISYRRQDPDRSFARSLVREVESAGFVAAIDERDFGPAATFLSEMERCITESRFTVCILSPRYFESGNTEEEAVICKVLEMSERRRRLIPLVIEEVQRPAWLYNIVGIDFTQSDSPFDPMDKLKKALKV